MSSDQCRDADSRHTRPGSWWRGRGGAGGTFCLPLTTKLCFQSARSADRLNRSRETSATAVISTRSSGRYSADTCTVVVTG
jgi:hypothetical protein